MSLPYTKMAMMMILLLSLTSTGLPQQQVELCPKYKSWCYPNYLIQFHVALPGYSDFILRFSNWQVYTRTTSILYKVVSRMVLSFQVKGRPISWIFPQLIGLRGSVTTLAVRVDNLYICGFANRTGHWHVFPKYKDIFPAEATVLDFHESYTSMLGGYENIRFLKLGQGATLKSTDTLSEYDKFKNGGSNKAARIALATLSVTICEAARFNPIKKIISDGWYKAPAPQLNMYECDYIVNWRVMSCALLYWFQSHGIWGIDGNYMDESVILKRNFNIVNPYQVLKILNVLIWPRPFKCYFPVMNEHRTSFPRRWSQKYFSIPRN